jgi:hypothetical protein
MQYQDSEDLEDVVAKVHKLAKRPRLISVVSITDGNSYTVKDDGGSYRRGEGIVPHGGRTAAIAMMDKKTRDRKQVFYAGERIASSDAYDAEISYRPKPVEPAFPGDPLAAWPVLDDAAIAQIHKNLAERQKNEAKSDKANAKEMFDVLAAVVNKAKQETPKIERAPRAQKAAANVES